MVKGRRRCCDRGMGAWEWMRSYPENVDSLECTLLWGGLLDYDTVFVKRKVWLGTDGQTKQITPKAHHWLCIQETTHMYVKNVEHLVYPFPHVDNSGNVTKLEELRAYILSDKT